MSRTLLVTGGSGYLGRVVAERAAAAGWHVTALSSRDIDIRDAAAVRALVDATAPDVIVHTAYVRDGPAAWPVIVDGTRHVAAAATSTGARLVHLSTDVVFDGRAGRPYTEDDPVSPVTPYGRAKAAAEEVVTHTMPTALVVRTSLIYGGPARAPSPAELAAIDPDGVFYYDELRCPVQVDDLAAGLLELAAVEASGTLHVAGPEGLSRHAFATLIAGHDVSGAPAPPGRPLDCRLDSSRATMLIATRLRAVSEVYGRTG